MHFEKGLKPDQPYTGEHSNVGDYVMSRVNTVSLKLRACHFALNILAYQGCKIKGAVSPD
jgi:hypothetical protein